MRVSTEAPEWIAPALTVVGVAALGAMVMLGLGVARWRARMRGRPEPDGLERRLERLEKLLEQTDERMTRLERPPAAIAPAPRTMDLKPGAGDPSDPLTLSVYALADRGHEPLDIARQLDEQVGKVELILALRKSR